MSTSNDIQLTRDWALAADAADPLSRFRSEFHIPSTSDISRPTLTPSPSEPSSPKPSIYLCGNSLGPQPVRTANLISTFLTQWRTKAVKGHFVPHSDSRLPPFLHIDDYAAQLMAPIVGALESEVAVMGTLTANLHLLMSSFYRPDVSKKGRWKIMLEGKAFPSDHFAVESQIAHWGLDPQEAMVLLEPRDERVPLLATEDVLAKIDEHKDELALMLLPGIQFYTGQYFDIEKITRHAHERGVVIGWDLAHAAGNVDLKLHDWGVDFAAWCSYKYLNSGPGAMAAIFVHEKFGKVDMDGDRRYQPRLTGWWGDDKSGRFNMTNKFSPRPGAAGFQVSNPSALDLAAVVASLQIFNEISMAGLRERSLRLTRFLELLLDDMNSREDKDFEIITPRDAAARGAQLSIRLKPDFLEPVLEHLDEHSVVIDERKPDVIRIAPAPLYNSFADIFDFCEVLKSALAVTRRRLS